MSESNFTPYLNGMTTKTKRELRGKLQAMNHKTLMRVNIKKLFYAFKEKNLLVFSVALKILLDVNEIYETIIFEIMYHLEREFPIVE